MVRRARPVRERIVPTVVERLTREFKYPETDPGPQGVSILGGGGGAPTVVVAASNASDLSKAKADFLCPGVNDHQVIQTAIDVLPSRGGRLLLTEGTFRCNYGQIVAGSSTPISIQGMGMNSTIMFFSGTTGPGFDISFAQDMIRDLSILDSGAGTGPGIRLHASSGARVDNVLFDNTGAGVAIDTSTSGAREVSITRCFSRNGGIGIDATPTSATGVSIIGNHFQNTGGDAIQAANITGLIIADNFINIFTGSNVDGIHITASVDHSEITGNDIRTSAGSAIQIDSDVADMTISANALEATSGYGINLDNDNIRKVAIAGNNFFRCDSGAIRGEGAHKITITGNTIFESPFFGTDAAISFIDPAGNLGERSVVIADNVIDSTGAGDGISLDTYDGCTVSANILRNIGANGINLIDSDDNKVADNLIIMGGGDAIVLSGDSDTNYIHGNQVIPDPASPPAHGINISAATCDCNIVVGNALGDAASYGTTNLNDAGTNTQLFWPSDPVIGDNFGPCPPASS